MARLSVPRRIFLALTTEPAEIWTGVVERVHERRERRRRAACPYKPVPDWDRLVHERLGVPWPCRDCEEFGKLWSEVVRSLTAIGLRVGPMGFGSWNDGDAGFVRAVWSLTKHLRAERVVETGVAHGFTSRFILEALAINEVGHLWSIDLPPLDPELRRQVGIAVRDGLSDRWTYISGSSRRRLPALLSKLEQDRSVRSRQSS